jgi:lysophospholipase L1-like esterase
VRETWLRRQLQAVAISVGVAVGVLLVAELVVRVADVEPMDWPAIDGKTRFRGIRVDPLLGPLLRPGWEGFWIGRFMVRVDARGFRSTELPPVNGHARRVAFLGDSCTFGWGMNSEDTFVAQLDALQRVASPPRFDLMNAAYPGQSAVVGVHMLRERVLALHPDLVVIGYSANNAFRFSLVSDAERFRFLRARKLLLGSRLLHIFAAWLVNRRAAGPNPRLRSMILETPLAHLKRVAEPDEFADALRRMIGDARAHGATPLLLLLPRASTVSTQDVSEDAGYLAYHQLPAERAPGGAVQSIEVSLLEASCLDHRVGDPIAALYERRENWPVVYPDDVDQRALLRQGAAAYVAGDLKGAREHFAEALRRQPDAPLARYDLGVSKLGAGEPAGLGDLEAADRMACNVFLHYQVVAWRVAQELQVPVVDITLHFQSHDGETLFVDPAHPNPAGHRIIAAALWAEIGRLTDQ